MSKRLASHTRTALISLTAIEQRIYVVRNQKVVNRDLADLYGVRTIALRQQVKRNA